MKQNWIHVVFHRPDSVVFTIVVKLPHHSTMLFSGFTPHSLSEEWIINPRNTFPNWHSTRKSNITPPEDKSPNIRSNFTREQTIPDRLYIGVANWTHNWLQLQCFLRQIQSIWQSGIYGLLNEHVYLSVINPLNCTSSTPPVITINLFHL